MNTPGAFEFNPISHFPFQPYPGWSEFGYCVGPIFIDASANAPSTSNTLSSEILPTPSSSNTRSSFVGPFASLNNATSNGTSVQPPPPNHGASGLQLPTEPHARTNVPLFQSATISRGSKRKADFDEIVSGPSQKKTRTLPIGQELSQSQVMIPQEHRDKSEPHHIPIERPQGCIDGTRNAPTPAESPQYEIFLSGSCIDTMQKALGKLGIVCGTLGMTANHQRVLLFRREDKKIIQDAINKTMGASYNNERWQGAPGIPAQNYVLFMGHHGQQQNGSGLDVPQSSNGQCNHQVEQLPQSGPSSYYPPSDSSAAQQTQIDAMPQITASSYDDSLLAEQQTSVPPVAESSTSSRKKTVSPRQLDPFVLVSEDMAKRRRSIRPRGCMSVSDSLPAVSEPSMDYPLNTVFAETLTKETFPHAQILHAAGAPKKRRGRGPAKSGGKGKKVAADKQPQLQREEDVAQQPKTPCEKGCGDQEPSGIQAGPSGSTVPESQVQEMQSAYCVSQQISNGFSPQEDIQLAGSDTQHCDTGYTGNVSEEFTLLNDLGTSQTPPSLQTDQHAFAATALSSVNQDVFSNFATGYYEAGGATTSQNSVSQPNSNETNMASLTGGQAEASCSNVSGYAWSGPGQFQGYSDFKSLDALQTYGHGCYYESYDRPQLSYMGPDVNDNFNLPVFGGQPGYTSFAQSFGQQDCYTVLPPPQGPGFVHDYQISGPSAGGLFGDVQAWNLEGV